MVGWSRVRHQSSLPDRASVAKILHFLGTTPAGLSSVFYHHRLLSLSFLSSPLPSSTYPSYSSSPKMPFLELSKDKISIWYTTNLKGDDIRNLDREKPTILMLHGMFLHTKFLAPQFSDPRLSDNFNLIAFDALNCGKTKNPVNPNHDLWCEAALIGIVTYELKLPNFHLMAHGMNPVAASIRFAMLFPNRALSMNLVAIPGEVEFVLDVVFA